MHHQLTELPLIVQVVALEDFGVVLQLLEVRVVVVLATMVQELLAIQTRVLVVLVLVLLLLMLLVVQVVRVLLSFATQTLLTI